MPVLTIPMPPSIGIGPFETSGPNTTIISPRIRLLGRIAAIVDRVAGPDLFGTDILSLDAAGNEQPAVAIGLAAGAGYRSARESPTERDHRQPTAIDSLPSSLAGLAQFRCIDPAKTHLATSNHQRIAVNRGGSTIDEFVGFAAHHAEHDQRKCENGGGGKEAGPKHRAVLGDSLEHAEK